MKSVKNLSNYPHTLPLFADSVVEFHAARILLLLQVCGNKNQISGLTKMAKLDFFVRYPSFFVKICDSLNQTPTTNFTTSDSPMIRYHYGPWDPRYYHILAYLESKQLVEIEKAGKSFKISLTKSGVEIAKKLAKDSSFEDLVLQMKDVKKVLGAKSGSQLKNLIYQFFEEEIAKLELEEVIKP